MKDDEDFFWEIIQIIFFLNIYFFKFIPLDFSSRKRAAHE